MTAHPELGRRLIETLYTDALILADEARSYFDRDGRTERDDLTPMARIGFSCESLRLTTRLMHVIAWLMTQRAVAAGEISEAQARVPSRRLAPVQPSDQALIAILPEPAHRLVVASVDLYERVLRLDAGLDQTEQSVTSPVTGLIARLQAAF